MPEVYPDAASGPPARLEALTGDHPPRCGQPRCEVADPPHHPLLHGAQKLGLTRSRERRQLVTEECPPVRRLEESNLFVTSVAECSPRMAEQLALKQRLWERRCVDRDERAPPAR